MNRKEALFRKATSIWHYIVGVLSALTFHFYPALAALLFVSFVAWEYSSSKTHEEACGDCWEALAGLVVGTAVLLAVRLIIEMKLLGPIIILARMGLASG